MTDETTQTYDRIASEFAKRFWDVRLERALDTFVRQLPPHARVLDLGCGPGRDTAFLRAQGYWVAGADLSEGMLREAQRRAGGALLQNDMRRLPFADASLHGVWLCAALLHIPREQAPAVLSEVRRVLQVDCPLYLSVIQGEGEAWGGDEDRRFFIFYQPDELTTLAQAAHFKAHDVWTASTERHTWINLLLLAV